jgi:hypothetical protein
VSEVAAVGRVPRVLLLDPVPAGVSGGADVAVGGGAVGRRGQH